MAVAATRDIRVARLHCFRLCSAQAVPLAVFYEAALGFERVGEDEWTNDETQAATGVGGRALRITIALGAQRLELLQFLDYPGRPYPRGSGSADLVFQHFALVAADMEAGMQRLTMHPGWMAISTDGPEQLPASSGGVTAFKFRDPEGHPLELLAFAADHTPAHWRRVADERSNSEPLLGIDHSAIGVSDSARSAAFYAGLGLSVSSRSLNDDCAQARLDGTAGATVEVTALSPPASTPHVELLCYRNADHGEPLRLRPNDLAATCLVFDAEQSEGHELTSRARTRHLRDPDGHLLAIRRSPG